MKGGVNIVNLQLSNKEWYFLHIQLENIIKENPDNYIAKNIFEKLVENLPKLNDVKDDFKMEYECIWVGDNKTDG